jgi:hypothetical protein
LPAGVPRPNCFGHPRRSIGADDLKLIQIKTSLFGALRRSRPGTHLRPRTKLVDLLAHHHAQRDHGFCLVQQVFHGQFSALVEGIVKRADNDLLDLGPAVATRRLGQLQKIVTGRVALSLR